MPFDTTHAAAMDAALCAAIMDLRPAMEVCTRIVADGIEANFRSESCAGDAWAPLAARTVEERERKGFGGAHPILNRTSVLKNCASAYREAMTNGAAVGPDGCDYAGVHLGGADGFGGGRVPVRDFLVQSTQTIDAIDAAIIAYLESNDG